MKNSVIAGSINKIAILILLSGSVVYHVMECLDAKENKGSIFKEDLSFSTTVLTNTLSSSPSFPFIILADRKFYQTINHYQCVK